MPRVAAAPLGVLIGLLIAACFVKPDPPQGMVSDARTVDAASGSDGGNDADVPLTNCTSYTMDTNSDPNCGGWAATTLKATTSGGLLTLTIPQSASTELALCATSPMAFTAVTLDISSITLLGQLASLRVNMVKDALNYSLVLQLKSDGSGIDVSGKCDGAAADPVLWTSASARYLRIRWTSAAEVQLQISGSLASSFVPLAICSVPAGSGAPQIRLSLERGSGGSAMSAGFDSVEVCE